LDKEEFESRISSIQNQLLLLASSRLMPSEAEDAVQNAIMSAWVHLPQLRNEESFDAWIKRILVNECNHMLREKKRQKEIEAKIAQTEKTSISEEHDMLTEALSEMNSDERELLLMHHDQGYSIAEISKSTGRSEDAVKMRLHRARKRLRIILISLLILLLGMAAAIGTGYLDVPWFFTNRRSTPQQINTDRRSYAEITYNGRYLKAEITDVVWDLNTMTLYFTYDMAGIDRELCIVHGGNIGVDGIHHDHIWINDRIIPIKEWSHGKKVLTYFLDGWKIAGRYLSSSEDYLPDGNGESFLAAVHADTINPDEYMKLVSENGTLQIKSDVIMREYDTGKDIEKSALTIAVNAPSAEDWRAAYEEYIY